MKKKKLKKISIRDLKNLKGGKVFGYETGSGEAGNSENEGGYKYKGGKSSGGKSSDQ